MRQSEVNVHPMYFENIKSPGSRCYYQNSLLIPKALCSDCHQNFLLCLASLIKQNGLARKKYPVHKIFRKH